LPESFEQNGLNTFCFSILKLVAGHYTSFGKGRYSFGADIPSDLRSVEKFDVALAHL